MASDRSSRGSSPITPVTAIGIEHVRLSYLYLDQGDIDGYLSLLHTDVSLHLPGRSEIRGRERIGAFRALTGRGRTDHLIQHVIGSGDRVAAEGRYIPGGGEGGSGEGGVGEGGVGEGVDFIEVFSLSEEGLLRSQKRYYFLAP
jgi:hypothetical protein